MTETQVFLEHEILWQTTHFTLVSNAVADFCCVINSSPYSLWYIKLNNQTESVQCKVTNRFSGYQSWDYLSRSAILQLEETLEQTDFIMI